MTDFKERIISEHGSLVYTNYGWRPRTLCDATKEELEEVRKAIVSELRRKGAGGSSSRRAIRRQGS